MSMMSSALLVALLIHPSWSAQVDCSKGCTISSSQYPFVCAARSGTAVQFGRCDGSALQEWSFNSDGTIRYSADATKCLEGNQQNKGVVLGSCNGAASQKWAVDQDNRISLGSSAKFCLAPVDDGFTPGSKLTLFVCTYYRDQQWKLIPGMAAPPIPMPNLKQAVSIITEAMPSKCLDVPGGKATAGNVLDLWDCNGLANQHWLFHSDGTIRYSGDTTMCIDVSGGALKQGTHVQLEKCSGQTHQKFAYDSKAATVKTSASSLCLDIPGGNTKNGAQMWVWGCNEYPQQQWYLQSAGGRDDISIV